MKARRRSATRSASCEFSSPWASTISVRPLAAPRVPAAVGRCFFEDDLLTSRLAVADTRVLHQLRELLYWYSMDVLQEALYVSQVPAPTFAACKTPLPPSFAQRPAVHGATPPVSTHASGVCTIFSFSAARSLGGGPPSATRLLGWHRVSRPGTAAVSSLTNRAPHAPHACLAQAPASG